MGGAWWTTCTRAQDMRQTSLERRFRRGGDGNDWYDDDANDKQLEVYDLFAGAGGFTQGAYEAGCRVVFACDASEEAIDTHRRNHPSAQHWCCKLPRNDLPLPQDGRPFHLHGSPPCVRFSTQNTTNRAEGDRHDAERLVEWYLRLAVTSGATSWTMEQVPSRHVISIVERIRSQYRRRVAYAVFDLRLVGVPQTRKRLVAGTPRLIAKLQRRAATPVPRSVRDIIENCRGTHIRNSKGWRKSKLAVGPNGPKYTYEKASWTDFCHEVGGPAPTVVAQHALTWVSPLEPSVPHAVLTPCELAALQTFPSDYKFPTNKSQAYLQIGNAVPPRWSCVFCCRRRW